MPPTGVVTMRVPKPAIRGLALATRCWTEGKVSDAAWLTVARHEEPRATPRPAARGRGPQTG